MHQLYAVCFNNSDAATVPADCSKMSKGQGWHILTIKRLIQSWLNPELVYECVKGSSPQYLQAVTQPHTQACLAFCHLQLVDTLLRQKSTHCGLLSSLTPQWRSDLPAAGSVTLCSLCGLNINFQGGLEVTVSPLNHAFCSLAQKSCRSLSLCFSFHNTFPWYGLIFSEMHHDTLLIVDLGT